MFKSITVLKIDDTTTRNMLRELPDLVTEPTITDPGKTDWSRTGFHKPDNFGESTVFVGADNTIVVDIQIRERLLPGKVIQKHVAERAAELEQRQGGKRLSRKERAAIKDEVVAALLPTAFIKSTDVLCMITKNYVIFGTSSASLVDRCLMEIDMQFRDGTPKLSYFARNREVGTWMFDLLDSGTTESGMFTCGSDAVLRGSDKSTARFKDIQDIDQYAAVRDALGSGMRPTELGLMYDAGTLSCAINDKLIIKKIKFSDISLRQAEEESDGDPVAYFDSNVALVSGTLVGLIDTLVSEMPEKKEDLGDEDDEL